MKVCKESGCGKKHFGLGWCAMHYSRMARHGSTENPPRKSPPNKGTTLGRKCTVPNCDRKHHGNGKCFMHFKRFYKHGDLNLHRTGWHHTEETKKRLSSTHFGIIRSPESRQKMSTAKKGLPSWNKGIKTGPLPESTRAKMRGRRAWNFGLPSPWKSWRFVNYNGTQMRSSYEVRFAKILDKRKMKWHYEPKRFNLGWCTYLPDFYVPAMKSYIEIKGWFAPTAQKKIASFRQLYPQHNLIVASDRVLKMFEAV